MMSKKIRWPMSYALNVGNLYLTARPIYARGRRGSRTGARLVWSAMAIDCSYLRLVGKDHLGQ